MNGHDLMGQVSKEELIKYCSGGTIIFDGRKYYPREAIDEFKSHELHYIGIGR